MNKSKPNKLQETRQFPKTYLHHHDGGHIKRDIVNPKIRQEGTPDQFRLVPVDENGNWIPLREEITTQSEYVAFLKRAVALGQDIAIQHEGNKGKSSYISCRTVCIVTGSALAEYRKSVGKCEKFRVEHCHETGTFSFRSHNDLYLHYNATFRTVAFKPEPASVAKWKVYPLGVTASDEESIIYVGVVKLVDSDKGGAPTTSMIMERTAAGVLLDRQDHARVINLLQQELSGGGCSSVFALPDTGHQWFVTVDEDTTAYIMITSPNYPQYLAVEGIQDLASLHHKYQDGRQKKRIEKYGLNETDLQQKEMVALMDHYDQEYALSTIKQVNDEMQALQQKMAQNIQALQENIESEEQLLETTNELLEMTKQFKKHTRQLKGKRRNRVVAAMAVGGAAVGGGIGFAVGGPGGALLATEAVEIGVGIGAGLCVGWMTSKVCLTFWEHKFVGLGRKLGRRADGSFRGIV